MATAAHFIKNTSKPYQCTQCGSENVSIIREDPVNPRLKCITCNFMFDGEASLAAIEAGAIKPSSPEALASAREPEVDQLPDYGSKRDSAATLIDSRALGVPLVPKLPAYVFLSKPRGKIEFCSKRGFKKTAIKWSEASFDVYELKPVKLSVNVNIS